MIPENLPDLRTCRNAEEAGFQSQWRRVEAARELIFLSVGGGHRLEKKYYFHFGLPILVRAAYQKPAHSALGILSNS